MSYLVLARKWRPQNFQDVVGQEAIVRTLRNALERDRVAHAMIFSGVRGVGKTTIARIMAKAINCHRPENRPCDQCPSCQAIIDGNSIDLHEIDGASNRGIQEIRDLKENLRFLPANERFKVIIIDEVHMLTTEAFNALLKTLEEPPQHVYFMFATTELHKVPVTILSRCQRYELKRVPLVRLVEFFERIARQEGVAIPRSALEIIGIEADGSVRDGLSLLDQVFSFCGDQVVDEDLHQVLGLVDRKIFAKIATAILESDLAQTLLLLNDSYRQGIDLKRFSHGLLSFFRSLLVCKTSRQPGEILDLSEQELTLLAEIAERHTVGTLSAVFDLLLKGIEEMQYATHPRMVLEMTFVKALQIRDIVPVSSILARLDKLLAGDFAEPPALTPGLAATPVLAVTPEKKTEFSGPSLTGADDPGPTDDQAEVAARQEELLIPAGETAALAGVATSVTAPVVEYATQPPVAKDVQRDWEGFIRHVKERKTWMAATLELSEKTSESGGTLLIKFDDPSECLYLQDQANMKLLTEFAQDFFQKELSVQIVSRGASSSDGQGQDRPQEERRALANDPRVQLTVEILGGQVSGIRTGPRSR